VLSVDWEQNEVWGRNIIYERIRRIRKKKHMDVEELEEKGK
jgi:hypothetical protein